MSQQQKTWRWIKAIALLPLVVLVLVPVVVLAVFHGASWSDLLATPVDWRFWVAIPIAGIGIILAGWTMSLFIRFGDGTAAPWDPPQKLVDRGPYRHVRNPMITGAIMILAAEGILIASCPLAVWLAIFTLGNAVYMPFVEERALDKRFGEDYADYKQHVPRWIPRLRPCLQSK